MTIINSKVLIDLKITKVIDEEYAERLYKGHFKISSQTIANKPAGFWLSVDGGWENWCKSEMPEWCENVVSVTVELQAGHNIMMIETQDDILGPWKEFCEETNWKPMGSRNGMTLTCFFDKQGNGCNFWDWLKNKYSLSGIYLTEEGQWNTRMTTFLYGWDCASVVVLDNTLIQKVLKLEKMHEKEISEIR